MGAHNTMSTLYIDKKSYVTIFADMQFYDL